MIKLSRSALQAALDSLVAANNRAFKAREKIIAHCESAYGHTPGDVDNDAYIDLCEGGNGMSGGMSAEEFEASMIASIRQQRLS